MTLFARQMDELFDFLGNIRGICLSQGLNAMGMILLDAMTTVDSVGVSRIRYDSRRSVERLHLSLRD